VKENGFKVEQKNSNKESRKKLLIGYEYKEFLIDEK